VAGNFSKCARIATSGASSTYVPCSQECR
jgi:hypothetical protein